MANISSGEQPWSPSDLLGKETAAPEEPLLRSRRLPPTEDPRGRRSPCPHPHPPTPQFQSHRGEAERGGAGRGGQGLGALSLRRLWCPSVWTPSLPALPTSVALFLEPAVSAAGVSEMIDAWNPPKADQTRALSPPLFSDTPDPRAPSLQALSLARHSTSSGSSRPKGVSWLSFGQVLPGLL